MYNKKPEGDYYNNVEWYEERNKQVYQHKMEVKSNKYLIIKYELSPARIQYLVKKERAKHEFKNTNVAKH